MRHRCRVSNPGGFISRPCKFISSIGRFRSRDGGFKSRVGDFRSPSGEFRSRVDEFISPVGRFRSRVGDFISRVARGIPAISRDTSRLGECIWRDARFILQVSRLQRRVGESIPPSAMTFRAPCKTHRVSSSSTGRSNLIEPKTETAFTEVNEGNQGTSASWRPVRPWTFPLNVPKHLYTYFVWSSAIRVF